MRRILVAKVHLSKAGAIPLCPAMGKVLVWPGDKHGDQVFVHDPNKIIVRNTCEIAAKNCEMLRSHFFLVFHLRRFHISFSFLWVFHRIVIQKWCEYQSRSKNDANCNYHIVQLFMFKPFCGASMAHQSQPRVNQKWCELQLSHIPKVTMCSNLFVAFSMAHQSQSMVHPMMVIALLIFHSFLCNPWQNRWWSIYLSCFPINVFVPLCITVVVHFLDVPHTSSTCMFWFMA